MIKLIFSVLLLLNFFSSCHAKSTLHNENKAGGNVDVVYYGFYAESYAGVSISSLEVNGCNYQMERSAYNHILHAGSPSLYDFNPRDVRAKLVEKGETPIYIDSRGVVQINGAVIIIDRKQFELHLRKKDGEPC